MKLIESLREAIRNKRDMYFNTVQIDADVLAALCDAAEALEPLAAIPIDDFNDFADKPDDRTVAGWNKHRITVGDVRAARATLAKLEQK